MTDNAELKKLQDTIITLGRTVDQYKIKYKLLLEFVKHLSRGLENGLTDFEEKTILKAQKILQEIGEV